MFRQYATREAAPEPRPQMRRLFLVPSHGLNDTKFIVETVDDLNRQRPPVALPGTLVGLLPQDHTGRLAAVVLPGRHQQAGGRPAEAAAFGDFVAGPPHFGPDGKTVGVDLGGVEPVHLVPGAAEGGIKRF